MKFIYKIVIKKLKEKFMLQRQITFWDKTFDNQFYSFYFKETSEDLGISLEEFYDPLNSKESKRKTLNNSYLKLILKS